MQNFKRKITYFYEHQNGMVGSTAGFMKLEIRGDKVKIIVNIQEPPGLPFGGAQLYLYHEAGDHLAAIKVDNVDSVDGVLTYQTRTDWRDIFRTGRDLYTFDGVAVVYNDHHYYIGDFSDRNRQNYELVKKERKPVIAKMMYEPEEEESRTIQTSLQQAMQSEDVSTHKAIEETKVGLQELVGVVSSQGEDFAVRQQGSNEEQKKQMLQADSVAEKEFLQSELSAVCKNCPYQKKRQERQAKGEQPDAFEEMIEKYPKLPMYGVTDLFDCVRIHPRDIGKLDMRNWKLGVNSFLTHSFYTYQYLLLGKMRTDNGKVRCVIGVPGVYSNRERYLANMFGFEQFVQVKQTGVKTGEFGYWIVEIMPSL
ncbi:MAG: hypothetical protein IJP29_06710 [Lachnospiraceae bacterium]|nr:hypothetical protein [Lachnospiraceae bacterium]